MWPIKSEVFYCLTFYRKKDGVLGPKSFMYGPTVYPGIKVEMGVSFACFMHIYTILSVLFIRRFLFLLKLKFVRIEFTPALECMLSICECLDLILSSTTKESNTNLFLDLVCLHSHISRYVNHYQMVTSLEIKFFEFFQHCTFLICFDYCRLFSFPHKY